MKYLIILIILGWSNPQKNSLEHYANSLSEASVPGVHTEDWINNNIPFAHPVDYLFEAYHTLLEKWEYVPDNTSDEAKPAELAFETGLKGDCEDFSAALGALCRSRNITTRYCLGASITEQTKGHIWLKVPVCKVAEYDRELEKIITGNFYLPVDTFENQVWINFISFKGIEGYIVEYEVDENGNLIKTK